MPRQSSGREPPGRSASGNLRRVDEPSDSIKFGVRGRVRAGEYEGLLVVVDVAGMTSVDPLVVVVSEDLDEPGHESETVTWVNPEDLDDRLRAWRIEWTDAPSVRVR